ncbi:hypothetical protein H6G00_01680 [Leptolyngbya sp. FACHB-541]|uniref:hypothetical protein n=1 Tax=Leptolyngbya sp. FACHB-541 TaxID=2692810 RepID=UPI001688401C|nr:hypothetical protein [Leptolyngbya sp. FACHB-541]MBD1995341.1 hypothetical protein [Leptolyngbya sp. FACHB-541]
MNALRAWQIFDSICLIAIAIASLVFPEELPPTIEKVAATILIVALLGHWISWFKERRIHKNLAAAKFLEDKP